jgi:phage FluMu protein Com
MSFDQIRLVERFRCSSCGRTLAKMEPNALRDGRFIEIKCPFCNRFNTVVGRAFEINDAPPNDRDKIRELNEALGGVEKQKLSEASAEQKALIKV